MPTVPPLSRRALLVGTAPLAVAPTVSHADERPTRVLRLGFQDDATTLERLPA